MTARATELYSRRRLRVDAPQQVGEGAVLNERQRIVVLVGLPGCGKSTWVAQAGYTALSSDAIRKWLIDDETDQTINARVFLTLRYLLRHRLAIGRAVTFV